MNFPITRLATTGAIAAVLLLTAACGGAEVRKARALEKGSTYLEAGNLDKARVEFRNALQLAPNDPEARYENGVVQERLGNIREALQLYQGAVDLGPDHVAARAALARIYLFSGVPERAMELLRPGLDKHPDDPRLLVVRAAARAQLKDSAGALGDAEHAFRIDPKSEGAVAVLAGLYTAAGRTDEAADILRGGVREHPQSEDLHLALAQLYAGTNNTDQAEAQLREIVRLKAQDRNSRIRLAQFLSGRGKDDAAEAVLREAIEHLPADRELEAVYIDFLTLKRGRGVAEGVLRQKVASAGKGDSEQRFLLARFYEQGREPAKAEAVLREVIAEQGTRAVGLSARNQLAALMLTRGDAAGAGALVGQVLDANARDADALVLRGNLALAKGDAQSAIVDLRAVLRDQPNSVGVLRALARAHLVNHEPALAEETLRRAVDAAPADPGTRFDLAEVLLQTGKAEQAQPILKQLATDRPADVAVQQALFRASTASKDFVAARTAADAIIAADPQLAIGHYFRGTLSEADGHVDAAVAEYDKAIDLQPTGVEPLVAVTRVLVAHGRAPDALKRLDAVAARSPKDGVPLAMKADLLVDQHRLAEAETTAREALERSPQWWAPYRALAAVAVAKGDAAGGIALLKAAVPKVKEPGKLRFEIARIGELHGQPDEAIAQYEEILKATPADLTAANNLAMLLVAHRSDAASIARAAALASELAASTNPYFLDTSGWVRLKQGDVVAALPMIEKAEAALPSVPEIQYHLGMAQLAAGQPERARGTLRQVLASSAVFPGRDDARATLQKLSSGS